MDDYRWIAHYDDDTWLNEEDHGFADIDLSRIIAFELAPNRDGFAPIAVDIDQSVGMRPIFFRRRYLTVATDNEQTLNGSVTFVGWQKTVAGRNVKSFVAILPDGSLLLADHDRAV